MITKSSLWLYGLVNQFASDWIVSPELKKTAFYVVAQTYLETLSQVLPESLHEKTNKILRQKQRCRSALTISLLL